MIMREVFVLIGAGLVAGFSLALALANLVRSQLFGLNPRDPLTFHWLGSRSYFGRGPCRLFTRLARKRCRSDNRTPA
jgi:hypothetical protein